jgi:uncharacterized repeat protein (TIGR01451 family)
MVICCFGALSAVAQEIGYIDFSGLTDRESTRHPRTHGSACGSSPHSRPSRSQVEVTLLSLDKTIYQIGEELTFEVKVQNTGTAPLVIPWTPHFADLEPNDLRAPYKYLAGVVVVQFKDSKQHWFHCLKLCTVPRMFLARSSSFVQASGLRSEVAREFKY